MLEKYYFDFSFDPKKNFFNDSNNQKANYSVRGSKRRFSLIKKYFINCLLAISGCLKVTATQPVQNKLITFPSNISCHRQWHYYAFSQILEPWKFELLGLISLPSLMFFVNNSFPFFLCPSKHLLIYLFLCIYCFLKKSSTSQFNSRILYACLSGSTFF